MLEARIQQGSLLKKIFDAIKEMVVDVNLECTDSGIQLQAMDGSHVSLVCMNLREAVFERYRCDRPRSLGLNMAAVAKVFKLCANDDAVTIRHEDEGDSVTFVFEGAGEDRVSDFELKLMNIEQDHLGIPESEFTATVDIPSKHFQRICADLGQFADSLSIDVSTKGVKFATKGDVGGGSTILKPKDSEGEKVKIETQEQVQLLFAVRYLNYFAKATPLASQVKLAMSSGQPLEVTYPLQDDDGLGYLKFYLAPKMDDDMDQE